MAKMVGALKIKGMHRSSETVFVETNNGIITRNAPVETSSFNPSSTSSDLQFFLDAFTHLALT